MLHRVSFPLFVPKKLFMSANYFQGDVKGFNEGTKSTVTLIKLPAQQRSFIAFPRVHRTFLLFAGLENSLESFLNRLELQLWSSSVQDFDFLNENFTWHWSKVWQKSSFSLSKPWHCRYKATKARSWHCRYRNWKKTVTQRTWHFRGAWQKSSTPWQSPGLNIQTRVWFPFLTPPHSISVFCC